MDDYVTSDVLNSQPHSVAHQHASRAAEAPGCVSRYLFVVGPCYVSFGDVRVKFEEELSSFRAPTAPQALFRFHLPGTPQMMPWSELTSQCAAGFMALCKIRSWRIRVDGAVAL